MDLVSTILFAAIGVAVGLLIGRVAWPRLRPESRNVTTVSIADHPAPSSTPPANALVIDDFYPVHAVPRYGYGKPTLSQIHHLLDEHSAAYKARLETFLPFTEQLLAIPKHVAPQTPLEPAWINGFLPALDSISLFGLVSTLRPRLFLEIGSGNSTKFAAHAKRLNSPDTQIISIDPHPRAEIDQLCNQVIRAPLETVDLTVLDQLADGDILFFDGSHRVFQNSDVAVFFLEVLPALKSGVYIHIHDILWPHDYPTDWSGRYYSEQYMLGVLLLFGSDAFDIVLPNRYLTWHTDYLDLFDRIWLHPSMEGLDRHGGSFWLRKR